MKEKINKGCEFQNNCIEYKDISYLKNMPICAIYELSIACHDKENKCKYYKLYKQLKRLEQENEKIKKQYNCYACGNCKGTEDYINLEKHHKGLRKQFDKYHKALEEIKAELKDDLTCESRECGCDDYGECLECLKETILNIITEAIGE